MSDNVERKTDSPAAVEQPKVQQVTTIGKNVLNKYRSFTYNFTLAGLNKNYLTDPEKYRQGELDLVILKSGGKGTTGIKGLPADPSEVERAGQPVYDKYDSVAKRAAQAKVDTSENNLQVTAGFNQKSPGRFDMYIDGVEIDTLMAFSPNSNTALPTQIKFEVFEPYSVNGFLEALHVASIGAGYTNYQQASFLLKVEFVGYPDSSDFSEPEVVPQSTRYFAIGFTGIDVDITEKGTRYRCSAVPFNDRAYGEPDVLKKPIKMTGLTVKDILTDLMTQLNKQLATIDKDGKETTTNRHNIYEIKFPSWSETDGWIDAPDNPVATTKLLEIFKDNALYSMVDPASVSPANAYKANASSQPTPAQNSKEPESFKYIPNKTVIQFSEKQKIADIITAVIRDSEYVRSIIKDVGKKPNVPDQYGMIDYFMVRIEVTNLDVIDEATKKPFQKFTYIVTPYKTHVTKVPSFAQQQYKEEDFKKVSLREYNYIYTGENIDVLNFKLSFNTLFFEAVPAAMGNSEIPAAKTGAGPTDDPNAKHSGKATSTVQAEQVPVAPVKVDPMDVQQATGSGGQLLSDPYSALAKKMHSAVIDSKASLITGELEILGDPLYVATGGIGNFNPKPASRGIANTGEATHLYGEMLIVINFKNPVDYDNTGMIQFDPNRVPFSGVYKVNKVSSSFKDGMFKQRLEVMRMPGQVLDKNFTPSDPKNVIITKPNPNNLVVADSTRSIAPAARLDASSAFEQLQRGLPSPGLPGVASNFTAAVGGLGGSAQNLLNQTTGAVSRLTDIRAGAASIGVPLPTDVASNIRLNSSGLANLSQSGSSILSSAALVAVATNVITGNVPAKRALGVVAGAVAGAAVTSILQKPNKGSGIGEGATISVSGETIPKNPTSQEVLSGANIDPIALGKDAVSRVVDTAKTIGTNAVDAVSQVGKDVGTFVNGVGDKLKALTATPADPAGVAASVGLDPSKVSGLGLKLPSGISKQLTDFANSKPEDVNLSQASNEGLVLNYIPASKVSNIPATQPYTEAQAPQADVGYIKQVVAKGGITALENLYGVNNISKLSTNLVPPDVVSAVPSLLPNSNFNPLSSVGNVKNLVDTQILSDKWNTVKSQLSSLTGTPNILDKNFAGSVSAKFGSLSSGPSPLDKLVNKLNDPNAPPYTGSDPIVRSRLGLPPLPSDE